MTLIIVMAFSIAVSAIMSGIVYLLLARKIKRALRKGTSTPNEAELQKHIRVLESKMERCENYLWGENNYTSELPIESTETLNTNDTIIQQKEKSTYSNSKKKRSKEQKAPKKESHQEEVINSARPEDVEYIALTVTDGNLTIASTSQVSYYRAWEIDGDMFYEFYSDKTAKAINNRSVIIEPFCEKDPASIPADKASHIETTLFGLLNKDYSVKTKTIIKFV
jgi:hypothetical protein